MANTLLTADMITRDALRILTNNCVMAKMMGRELNKEWNTDRKIGETVRVRVPPKYTVRDGKTFSAQDIKEEYVNVSIDTMKGVDVSIDSSDLRLSLQSFSDQVTKPAMSRLANFIDYDVCGLFSDIYGAVGTPGDGTLDADDILGAKALLDEDCAPTDPNRILLVDPRAEIKAVSAFKGLFAPNNEISQQYRKGSMGQALGFDWYMSQNVNSHTTGSLAGTPLVKGATQTGSSLATDGWTASTDGVLKKGDIITLASVNHVNPANQNDDGQLAMFVVTADVDSDSSGEATVPIYPSIVTSGAGQTVSASPADNAVIKILGDAKSKATKANLAFHRDAFKLVFVELPTPKGVDMASTISVPEIGMSLSFVRWFDGTDRSFKSRFDVLYGKKTVRPEFAKRIHM